jgi:2-phosphosulfolactate phosphatase
LRENDEGIKIRVGVKGVEEAADLGDVIVVVDVLRASSTIITAMANGALSIVPALTVKQAKSIARTIPDSILGGERKGLRIPGFGLGNSPIEYTTSAVRNRNIVFTTTNCTRVLERCKQLPSTKEVFIGAFLNATAIAREAKKFSDQGNKGISIVQAGSSGKSSLDDLICAEMIKTMIQARDEQRLTHRMKDMIDLISYVVLSNTKHGKYLASIGFDEDLKYCSQVGIVTVVPRLERNRGTLPRIIGSSLQHNNQ